MLSTSHHSRLAVWSFVLLALALLALQSLRLHERPYRLDETMRVQAMVDPNLTWVVANLAIDPSPFGFERSLGPVWVALTGDHERTTRHLMRLTTLLALAFLYRLVADNLSRREALWSVFILITLPVYFFYSYDTGPYPLNALVVAGTWFFLLRTLRHPTRRVYSLGYTALALAGTYIHFFGTVLVVAHFLFIVTATRFTWRRYGFFLWIFALVALGFVAVWGIPLYAYLTLGTGGGIGHGIAADGPLSAVFRALQAVGLTPLALLLLPGVVTTLEQTPSPLTDRTIYRGGQGKWWWLVGVPLLTIVVVFTVDNVMAFVTPRNLILLAFPAAVLAAYVVTRLGPALQVGLVALLLVRAATLPPLSQGVYTGASTLPNALNPHLTPGSAFVIENTGGEYGSILSYIPYQYYLLQRLAHPVQPDDLLLITNPLTKVGNQVVDLPYNTLYNTLPGTIIDPDTPQPAAALRAHIADRDTVFHLHISAPGHLDDLDALYAETHYFDGRLPDASTLYTLDRYRRVPENARQPLFTFDDSLRFTGVSVGATVAPCAALPLDSWWQATATNSTTTDYSAAFSLSAPDGATVTQVDQGISETQTRFWQPGRYYHDRRALTVPCDTPPGDYALVLVVHPATSPASARVTTADGQPHGDVVFLQTVTVTD